MLILSVPLLITLLLAAGIVCICLRRWIGGLLCCVAAIALNLHTQTFALHLPAHTAFKPQLRIMSYNIGLRNEQLSTKGRQQDTFLAFILDADADIIVLPESRMWDKPELHDRLCQHYAYNIGDAYDVDNRYIETWVYSRYPISNVRQLADGKYIYLMDITLSDTQQLRLVACHLSSNQANSSLTQGGGIWQNISSGYAQRQQEADMICDSLGASLAPLIICGDLNDLSGSSTLRTMQQRLSLQDAWWTKGCGYGCTFTGKHLYFRLDHILYSSACSISAVSVPQIGYSDHYPIIADFDIQQ